VAHRGSRLSAVRWAADHAVHEALGIKPFDLDRCRELTQGLLARIDPPP
jgi:hypothetical protein